MYKRPSLGIVLSNPKLRLVSLSLCVSFTLLLMMVISLGALPALAQRTDDPTLLDVQVAVGGQFQVQGYQFAPANTYSLRLVINRNDSITLGQVTSNRRGAFGPERFVLPARVAPGQYSLQAFTDVGGTLASALFDVQPAPTLQLSPISGAPGTPVEVTVENLIPGTLRIDFGNIPVIGPMPIRDTTFSGRFVIPASRDGEVYASAVQDVHVVNLVGALTVGSASARLTVDEPTPAPDYVINNLQTPSNQLRPGEPFVINGKLDPPPVGSLDTFEIIPYWQDENGIKVPVLHGTAILQANGEFEVAATVPSLLRGDSLSGKPSHQFGVDVIGVEGTATALSPAANAFQNIGAFRVSVVKDMPGSPQDGKQVPNTPAPTAGKPDPLQVEIEQLGVVSATLGDVLDLSSSEPVLDPTTIYGQLLQTELLEQGKQLVDKLVNCTKLVDQTSDLFWWEWVIDPYDAIAISTFEDQMFDPSFNFANIPEAPVNAPGTAANAAAINESESVLVFVYKVIVDASRVVDGAQKGYGVVNDQNVAIPTEKIFMWIPFHNYIFEIVPDMENETLNAQFVDNPAPIKLPPLPEGWQSNLQITDVGVKGFHIPPSLEDEDPRIFGTIHSFNRPQFNGLNPAISFDPVDPLRIEVRLANFGYDTTLVEPIVTIKVDGTNYPVVKAELTQESPQGFSCYQNEAQFPDTLKNFVWYTEIPNPHRVTAGDHPVEVTVSDGANTTQSKSAILRYGYYPSWFDDLPIENRSVEWGPFSVYLRGNPLSPAQAKTNVSDQIDELGDPNSKANLGSSFECKLGPWGAWPLTQEGDMNSAALDNPAAELPFDQFGYCNSGLSAASLTAPSVAKKVTILDTGKIRVFQASYGIPGIATVGIAVDFRVYATGLINATLKSAVQVELDSGVEVDIVIEADILLGLASADFGFSSDIGVLIPTSFGWDGSITEPEKCFHYQLDLVYTIEVLFGAVDVASDEFNVFQGDEPNGCFNFVAAAQVGSRTVESPETSNPVIATDGFGQTLSLWRNTDGNIVYSLYNGGSWSAPQTIVANGKSGDPALAFFGPSQAVAVWSQSGLATPPAPGTSLADILKEQHLAFSVWDGANWSSPQNLTTPTTGDGKVALAGCSAASESCPAGGQVTAVWVHDAVGDVAQRQFRLQSATFQNNAWSAVQQVDNNSNASNTEPAVAYVGDHPLAVWVRDGDADATTTSDRQLTLRFLDGGNIETPGPLPSNALNPSLVVDSQGDVQMSFTVVAPQDGLISNRRMLYRAKGACDGTTTCTWTTQQIMDSQGRGIFAESPVVTVDDQNKVTLTYRAMGFDPVVAPLTPLTPLQEPLGVVEHTGELAQIELPSALLNAGVTPNYLTGDGAVNWRPAAIYVPTLDATLALAVKGQPPIALAKANLTAAQTATVVERAERIVDDQPVIFASLQRLPNFVLKEITASEVDANGGVSVTATILNAGVGWTAGAEGPVHITAFWDDSAWQAQGAGSATLDALAAGESKQVILAVAPPQTDPGGAHTLQVIVNRDQPIAEQVDADNTLSLSVNELPPPEQVRSFTVEDARAAFLEWEPPSDARVVGYRIYRMVDGGSMEAVGASTVPGWADYQVQWQDSVQYVVRSYGADLQESTDSEVTAVTIPSKPAAEPEYIHSYLPLISE